MRERKKERWRERKREGGTPTPNEQYFHIFYEILAQCESTGGLSKCMRNAKRFLAVPAEPHTPLPDRLVRRFRRQRWVRVVLSCCREGVALFAAREVCSPCAAEGAVSHPTRHRSLCLYITTRAPVARGVCERREKAGEREKDRYT